MWQRWNAGTKIFEKSSDNGASWTPLGLNASIITEGTFAKAQLPGVIAYEDENNSFSGRHHIFGGSGTAFSTAPIEIQMASFPRVAFHWPGVVASQIGVDTAGTITCWDNPGTGLAAFRAGNVYANGWYYEVGRGTPQGHRIAWTPTFYSAEGHHLGGSVIGFFSLVGTQLFWSIYCVNFTIPYSTAYIRMTVPAGWSPISATTDQPSMRLYVPTIGDEWGYCHCDASYFYVYRAKSAAWPAGVGHTLGQGFYWVG